MATKQKAPVKKQSATTRAIKKHNESKVPKVASARKAVTAKSKQPLSKIGKKTTTGKAIGDNRRSRAA